MDFLVLDFRTRLLWVVFDVDFFAGFDFRAARLRVSVGGAFRGFRDLLFIIFFPVILQKKMNFDDF